MTTDLVLKVCPIVKVFYSQVILKRPEKVIVSKGHVRAVRRLMQEFPTKIDYLLTSHIRYMRSGIVM